MSRQDIHPLACVMRIMREQKKCSLLGQIACYLRNGDITVNDLFKVIDDYRNNVPSHGLIKGKMP